LSDIYNVIPVSDTRSSARLRQAWKEARDHPLTRSTEEVVEKNILSMAVNWMDYDLRKAVIAVKNQRGVRIKGDRYHSITGRGLQRRLHDAHMDIISGKFGHRVVT
jgi:hypothetical protein